MGKSLAAAIAFADLVGLGEVSHGDHESFALKVEVIRHLVAEHGCRRLVLEKGAFSCRQLNEWVAGRDDRSLDAVAGGRLFPWNCGEMAELLTWLREWNTTSPDAPVVVAGNDPQDLEPAMDLLRLQPRDLPDWTASLARMQEAIDWIGRAEADGSLFPDEFRPDGDPDLTAAPLFDSAVAAGRQLLAIEVDLERGNEGSRLLAAQSLLTTLTSFRLLVRGTVEACMQSAAVRDDAMADRLIEMAAEGGLVCWWAHDGHVAKAPPFAGDRLAQRLGSRYCAVGVRCGVGAIHVHDGSRWQEAVLEAPPPNSVETELSSRLPGAGWLDLRAEAAESPFRQARLGRTVGTRIHGEQFEREEPHASRYDFLVWLPVVTPSHLEAWPRDAP